MSRHVRLAEHDMAQLMISGRSLIDPREMNGHRVGDAVTVIGRRYDRDHTIAAFVSGNEKDGFHLERDDRPSLDLTE